MLARQLFEAGTSVGANVEEAQAAQSKADFVPKMCIALKEARESVYWLRLAQSTIAPVPADASQLGKEAWELVLILAAIVPKARLVRRT